MMDSPDKVKQHLDSLTLKALLMKQEEEAVNGSSEMQRSNLKLSGPVQCPCTKWSQVQVRKVVLISH